MRRLYKRCIMHFHVWIPKTFHIEIMERNLQAKDCENSVSQIPWHIEKFMVPMGLPQNKGW